MSLSEQIVRMQVSQAYALEEPAGSGKVSGQEWGWGRKRMVVATDRLFCGGP